MRLLIKWVLFALTMWLIGYYVPGITVENFQSAFIVCAIMALINIFVKPLIKLITLPINLLTLGLFGIVINALMFWLAGYLAEGIVIDGFISGLIGSLIMTFAGVVINGVLKK